MDISTPSKLEKMEEPMSRRMQLHRSESVINSTPFSLREEMNTYMDIIDSDGPNQDYTISQIF